MQSIPTPKLDAQIDAALAHLPDRFINPAAPEKPLLLVDADEVLLQFMEGLQRYARNRGLDMRLDSFMITGNLYRQRCDTRMTGDFVRTFLAEFFDHWTDRLMPVDGAAEGLARIAKTADVAILSNVPSRVRERRLGNLARHGMPYPVIANKGGKGPTIARLAAARTGFVGFIDDLPPQLDDAARFSPNTYRVHSVADPRLRGLIPRAESANIREDKWDALADHLSEVISQWPIKA